jgi:cytochrome c oxidase subunit IV
MSGSDFKRQRRRIVVAWLALLVLMLSSLGSAYLSLGTGNLVAGLVIATVKSTIVAMLFMGLAKASTMVRIAAGTALATWFLLVALSGVDYATRPHEPAPYQTPAQVPAFNAAEENR